MGHPALIAGVGLQVLGQATGVKTVIYYAPAIFKHAGPGSSAAILATVGAGIVNMVMTVAGMNLVDRIGRRRLLMIGAGIQGLALVALSVTFSIGGLSAGTLALSPRPGGAASRTSKSISISAPSSTSRRG